MKKYEYLSELEKRLSALPEAERRDALNYYEEYFDAAGTENEDATAAELGDPAETARKILEGEGLTPDAASAEAPTPLVADPAPHRDAAIPPVAGVVLGVAVVLVFAIAAIVCLFGVRSSFVANTAKTLVSSTFEPPQDAAPTTETPDSDPNEESAPVTAETTDTTRTQSDTITFDRKGVKNTTFYIGYGTVVIETSNAVTLPTLSYTNIHEDWFNCYAEDTADTIRVSYTVPANYDLGRDDVPQFTLTVPSPRSFTFDALHIEVDMGDVQFRGDVEADTVNVAVGMGNFGGGTVAAKEFSANVSMGNFDLDKLNGAQTTAVNVDMGNIGLTVDGRAEDYDLDLTTDMGNVAFNGMEQGNACHAKSTQAHPRSVILTADMGDVVLTTAE